MPRRTAKQMQVIGKAFAPVAPEVPRGDLGKLVRRRKPQSSSDDPVVELRRLVKQHRAWTKKAVAIENMTTDRVNRETGEEIPCDVPPDIVADAHATAKRLKLAASSLESQMLRQLRQMPVFTLFLDKVFGCGPVVSAYLASMIDITRAEKVSNLRRYCGLAVIDGRLERRTSAPKSAGGEGSFNDEIRTRLYQMFSAMRKNSFPRGGRGHVTSKYLDVWNGYKHRVLHSERVVDGKVEVRGKQVSANGFADSTGWHKAADVFVEDLYIVMRALAGLPVWPSYYAAKLGFAHGGTISVNAPRMLSLDEALALVGDVGAREVREAAE